MGLVTVNTKSKIIARMLDRDPAAEIDAAWFEARLARALAHRERLYPQPYYRLVHAEADGLPGVVIEEIPNPTAPGSGEASLAALPDGRALLYTRDAQLWIAPVDGAAEPRRLLETAGSIRG